MQTHDTELKLAGELTHRECATVLAALRLFQEVATLQKTGYTASANQQCPYVGIHPNNEIFIKPRKLAEMEHFEDTKPLTANQIDTLCERINLQPIKPKILSINLDPSKPLPSDDTGILNQIEDLLVNQFGEDERPEISGDQTYELLRHIADDLLDQRMKPEYRQQMEWQQKVSPYPAEPGAQWKTKCPVCGGQLYVTEVYVNATGKKAYQHEELHADGFSVPATADLKDGSTQDEVVTCGGTCGRTYGLHELEL